MPSLLATLYVAIILLSSCEKNKGNSGGQAPAPVVFQAPPDIPLPSIPAPARTGFVNVGLLEDTMLLDLQSLRSDRDRQNTRYLVGCDRQNLGTLDEEFRQGLDLAMNRLSDEVQLTPVTPIGSADCVYRIDISDYSLTRTEWREIEQKTLFNFESRTIRNQNLQFITQTRKPYIFATETCLMFECDEVAQRDIYYDLVDQALETEDFLTAQGIDLQEAVDAQDEVYFSGFSQSPIALQKTRMVTVVRGNNGYCMGTYDTALGGDDLFENTFTPELARAGGNGQRVTDKEFQFDAQEWICQQRNGLYGLWRLNNNNGDKGGFQETEAPTNIVSNAGSSLGDVDGAIRIGDCGNCHFAQVAIPFRDQLQAHVLSNSAYNAVEKRIASVFLDYTPISALVNQINREESQARQELGITAATDPLSNKVWAPIRREMDSALVASMTFMPEDEFLERLRGTARSSQVFGNLLGGGTVSLRILSDNFNTLVEELNLFQDNEL